MRGDMRFQGGIVELAGRHPWPEEKPDLPMDDHGWFGWCHEMVLEKAVPPDARLVLELGSWLGKSTRYFLTRSEEVVVIAVDHWAWSELIAQDAPECRAKMANLYEAFLSNCWTFRDRLVQIRANTLDGMKEVSFCGVKPDLVYIDANHTYEDFKADAEMSLSLFPSARLCGDDYGGKWEGVKAAIDELCAARKLRRLSVDHSWALYREDEAMPTITKEEIEARRPNDGGQT